MDRKACAALLQTKLRIPRPRPGLVLRPRLLERLDAGLQGRLTLVSAPAGFGKTTLLAAWAAHCGGGESLPLGGTAGLGGETPPLPGEAGLGVAAAARGAAGLGGETPPPRVAWLSLDEGDNDAGRFLRYLVAALQGVAGGTWEDTGAALDAPQPAIEAVEAALVNEAAALPAPTVLVLDDYHLIEARPVHEALAFLVSHLPPQVHLVIATRADPPLPLARLRARGQLTELRQADLRFTPAEAAEFLNRTMGLRLAPAHVEALAARTEGWIAGLQLAALSLHGHEDATAFVRAFSGKDRFILDYLGEEVLARQPEAVQTFLLRTSILDQLCGPLCDALGCSAGQAMLEELERANLFIVPLDCERRWYRYHQLFSDLLRKRLRQSQPELEPELHRRASAWHEAHGSAISAVDHALAARDFERAARLAAACAEALWGEGRQSTLWRWLGALPADVVRRWPRLAIVEALLRFTAGRIADAEASLSAVEGALPGEVAELRGMAAAVRAYIAYMRGDVPAVMRHCGEAQANLPPGDSVWHSLVATAWADACASQGDLAEAGRSYQQAAASGQAAGSPFAVLMASIKHTTRQRMQGHLRLAAEECARQLQLASASGLAKADRAAAIHALWGEILCQWDDLDAALEHVGQGRELAERGSNLLVIGWCCLCQVRVLLAVRDLTGAAEALGRLQGASQGASLPGWMSGGAAALRAWVWLEQGRVADAAALLEGRGLHTSDEVSPPRATEYLVLARLLVYRGRQRREPAALADALSLAQRIGATSEAARRLDWALEALLVEAMARQAQGEEAQALVALERALVLGEDEGYVRIFAEWGEPMAELLRELRGRVEQRAYIEKLLLAFGNGRQPRASAPSIGVPSVPSVPPVPLLEPLSPREREVLALIADGLSNQEIALQLYLSLPTVKWHTGNIYGKLGVRSRTQAVAAARALGLLPHA